MLTGNVEAPLAFDVGLSLVVEAMVGGVEIREVVDANEQRHGQNCAQDEATNSFGREIHLRERLGHPRRRGKLEFKEKRYPPLDVPTCCAGYSG